MKAVFTLALDFKRKVRHLYFSSIDHLINLIDGCGFLKVTLNWVKWSQSTCGRPKEPAGGGLHMSVGVCTGAVDNIYREPCKARDRHTHTQRSPLRSCTCPVLSYTPATRNVLRLLQPCRSLIRTRITMRSWYEYRPSKLNGNYPLRNHVTLRIITMFCVIFFRSLGVLICKAHITRWIIT